MIPHEKPGILVFHTHSNSKRLKSYEYFKIMIKWAKPNQMKRFNVLHGPKPMDKNFGPQLGLPPNPKYGSYMDLNQLNGLIRNIP